MGGSKGCGLLVRKETGSKSLLNTRNMGERRDVWEMKMCESHSDDGVGRREKD